MPWKDQSVVDQRLSFIARLQDGESMTELCREFGISRKTGYKFQRRYDADGPMALQNQGRRPLRLARSIDPKVAALIVKAKERRPSWGAGKLLVSLKRDYPGLIFPARSTVHLILDHHGLVKKARRRSGYKATGTPLLPGMAPNQLWCADYKGQFKLGDHSYCYPLTITDHFSRYLLACDGHSSTRHDDAIATFKATFEEFGLPEAIRTDNGVPFASQAIFGLSELSVWWMRLGIRVERIKPGHPEQNGRHERMHRTMKEDPIVATPARDLLRQQDGMELFRDDFNERRPHHALDNRTPADVYQPSPRRYSGIPTSPDYPDHDTVHRVTKCGSLFICNSSERLFLGKPLGHQPVGVKEVEDDIWQVQFLHLNLGYYDRHEGVFHRGDQ